MRYDDGSTGSFFCTTRHRSVRKLIEYEGSACDRRRLRFDPGGTHLGSQVKVDVTLLKLESDQQWHLVAHVQDDVTRERGGFGKVLKVLQGKGERDGLLEDDADAIVFVSVGHLGLSNKRPQDGGEGQL